MTRHLNWADGTWTRIPAAVREEGGDLLAW